MGYSTDFYGDLRIDRPVDSATAEILNNLNASRRMGRSIPAIAKKLGITETEAILRFGIEGALYFDDASWTNDTVIDGNTPPKGQPSLWCNWELSDCGTYLCWDGGEKAYEMDHWIAYIIKIILAPRGYVVNGEVDADGEEQGDNWQIVVKNNVVYRMPLQLMPDWSKAQSL